MRGLAAVGAGLGATFVLAFTFEWLIGLALPDAMDASGRVSAASVLGMLLAGGVLSSAMGGHALFLAAVALALAMFISILNWDRAPGAYHVASWLLLPLACVAGASVRVQALRERFGPAFDDEPYALPEGR